MEDNFSGITTSHNVIREPVADVTEETLKAEMEHKAGGLMNDHMSDMARPLAEELRMDLWQPYIEACVFMDLDRLVEGHDRAVWVGRAVASDGAGRQRMKTGCKLLAANLLPDVLRVDVERLVDMAYREAKVNDVYLHGQIATRTVRQLH